MNEAELEDLTTRSLPKKPTLADAINFQTDIAPYPLISIWAGVGAGKNYFVEQMITGSKKYSIPRMNVLIITSRKAKVAETLKEMNADIVRVVDDDLTVDEYLSNPLCWPEDSEEYKRVYPGIGSQGTLRSVICTNAFIENYLKYCYHPEDSLTHIWNRFDVIVWDEAHALHTDSSYQSAPFHVMMLMAKTYKLIRKAEKNKALPESERDPSHKRIRCKHLIFMTGTPEAIKDIPIFKKTPILNRLETCRSVAPANIHFLESSQATLQISEQLQHSERIVYFSNHTVLPKALSARFKISNEKIAVSFSNEEKRSAFEASDPKDKTSKNDKTNPSDRKKTDYERMIEVEAYLAEHSCICPNIQLFATTTRNKEGININDTDIRHVYVESHSMTDIKQMAGRIRNGVEHLYIIMDSPGFVDLEGPYASYIGEQLCGIRHNPDGTSESQTNTNLDEFCKRKKIPDRSTIRAYDDAYPELGKYIDQYKKLSEYCEFDYLSNKFRFNVFRKNAKEFYAKEIRTFNDAAGDPADLVRLFQKEFPNATIHPPVSALDQAYQIGWDFMHRHPDGNFTQEEFWEMIYKLDELLTSSKNRSRRKNAKPNPNILLRKIGLHYDRRNHKPGSPGYLEYTIEPFVKKQSKAA